MRITLFIMILYNQFTSFKPVTNAESFTFEIKTLVMKQCRFPANVLCRKSLTFLVLIPDNKESKNTNGSVEVNEITSPFLLLVYLVVVYLKKYPPPPGLYS